MNNLCVVILAAGRGTRMYSDIPKVLHPIGNKPMLTHVIDTAQTLQPTLISVVVGFGREMVIDKVNRPVQWVEQTEQLGTGHAMQCAMPTLPENGITLILYGDVPLIDKTSLQELIDVASECKLAILTDIVDNPTGYGRIIRCDKQKIIGIVEEKDANNQQKQIKEINTGIIAVDNQHLANYLKKLNNNNAQQEYYLTDIIELAVQNGIEVKSVTVKEHYLVAGVNNKLQLAELTRIYQQNLAKELMLSGVSINDPARFDLRGTLNHGKDVIIDVDTIFEGKCTLGNRVKIGAFCVLKNVTIADDVEIKPFSHLENCTIGANSQIGPFSRLRPDAVLAENTHIGNFVEIKKSFIGNGSKVNHLTYIGDTHIGQNTNIGAGTVTCNYDGVNKFKTEIGDEVRIGSGTLLVAPVKVGNRATTGAGSVITKNCPAEKLTISRVRQNTIDNWVRPEKDK
ncbi:MAG: bifunctional UDP-N-acetylglucosamine diphosphorylase/glucosamine-1-phosphate N-acetyltransferase GlmU [Neisseriaceae bacterium]|nr:bifunctional UDP-N-acetylglucosamine diphosphorylase/glucosamine-1-phosphate N-acetyltransferase GlmU [Neisseriaceae bacterium]